MRYRLKKFSIPILIIFWAYTWHAYALGAVGQKDFFQETPRTVLKQNSPDAQALSKIQNKIQFKRRPFISKGDIFALDSIEFDRTLSFVEHQIPFESFVFCAPSAQIYLLRSPPSLI